MSSETSYKKLKEDFVSGLTGGSVTEINYVTAVAPIGVLLWSVLQARQSFFTPYGPVGVVVDFLLNVAPFLLATTLYADQPILLSLLLLAPAVIVYVLPPSASSRRRIARKPKPSGGTGQKPDMLAVKPFLTTYRANMMIVTCVAILAVDFRLFPRRFAKVETWGTSLMDMGVGSFVFSAGVVAARPVLREKMTGRFTRLPQRMAQALRHSIPLLVLGVVRLLSVKGLDYAEHVTEYGVHWNFFFTLAFLPPFVAAFQAALSVVPSHAALALFVSGGYQLLLERTELKAYILTAPRLDLISQNREGIFSFFGYLAIFLAGQDLGMFVMPRSVTPRSTSSAGVQRNTLLMTMAVWAAIWTALYFGSTSWSYGLGLDVSRRLANLPYVLWVTSFNSVQLLAFCAVDTLFFPAFYNATDARSEREAYNFATSPVLRAINRNGLPLFLLANLLTGLVHLTVPTLDAGPALTMGILVAYSALLTGVALVLDACNISIKI
jgi:phosphatidylinositol glycan class W